MIFDCKMGQNTLEELLDKENIRELVEFERYCRDYEHWDQMRTCYHDDATVCTSWTTAKIDDFVEGSKKRRHPAPAQDFQHPGVAQREPGLRGVYRGHPDSL